MGTCAWQLDTPADQAAVEREWALLTGAFLSKWSEVTEESLTTKVIIQALFVWFVWFMGARQCCVARIYGDGNELHSCF